MRRSKKQEIVSRILVSSSVFILGSPILHKHFLVFLHQLHQLALQQQKKQRKFSSRRNNAYCGELLPEQQEGRKSSRGKL